MVFSSITFLFYFLPIVLIIYYLIPNKYKNIVLLISSFIFYFYGEPKNIYIMILSILATYIFGILIDKYKKTKYSKIFLILSIFINIGLLIYFKYADFIIKNINLWLSNKIDLIHVILPIGISFYTFQLISYIVDVYRGEAKVQKNIIKLSTYISLFPQLIAGPIVRYTTIENQLENREYNMKNFSIGVRRFIIGLGKKVMIANVMGNLINIFLVSDEKSVLFYWLYAIALMIQIYFDFSGYSDMAIGLGKMLGFDFPENFNYPYIATSITDFWRRWHISLSSWFRDYIYIPLGGNRVSKLKWIRNIIIVWMLTGLWHGAEWNFVIWGLYFGVLLIIEKVFLLKWLQKIPKVISRIYTLFIVMISFIIFNGEGISTILENIGGLFKFVSIPLITNESMYYLKSYIIVIILGIIGATPICKNILTNEKLKKIVNILEPIYLLLIFIICTSYIVDGSFNPFLYFRF
ncbi:mBOAT family protein [Clostridium sp. CAG:273]|nr:MBOAT family O-acyltransferase [Clostridia bacterium]CDE83230.1 mBOAT family protein [Clostridium sp. CAG:273]